MEIGSSCIVGLVLDHGYRLVLLVLLVWYLVMEITRYIGPSCIVGLVLDHVDHLIYWSFLYCWFGT